MAERTISSSERHVVGNFRVVESEIAKAIGSCEIILQVAAVAHDWELRAERGLS